MPSQALDVLTHYYRPFSLPLRSLTRLPAAELARALDELARHEPLPFRLTQPAYLPERRRIEARLHRRFVEKGGAPQLEQPHYFVLGEFSLWEGDGSRKVQIPLASVPTRWLSFTLTDSYFNDSPSSLRGIPIPARPYHGELFTAEELPAQLRAHGLPSERWRSDPASRFDVYVEAQVWSDEPVRHLLAAT